MWIRRAPRARSAPMTRHPQSRSSTHVARRASGLSYMLVVPSPQNAVFPQNRLHNARNVPGNMHNAARTYIVCFRGENLFPCSRGRSVERTSVEPRGLDRVG